MCYYNNYRLIRLEEYLQPVNLVIVLSIFFVCMYLDGIGCKVLVWI